MSNRRTSGKTHARNNSNSVDYNDILIGYLVKGFNISGVDRNPKVAKQRVIAEMRKMNFTGDALDILGAMCKWMLTKYSKLETDQASRSHSRAVEIKSLAGDIKPKGYYDLGCGDGAITKAIGDIYGLPRTHVYGADMFAATADITPIKLESSNTVFATSSSSIHVPDASIDLITAFVSLHHIEALDSTLEELKRIAAPSCVLIIREHDCADDTCKTFLNRHHAAMMMTGVGELAGAGIDISNWPDAKKQVTNYMNSIHYRSADEWTRVLGKHGFKYESINKYSGFNPQQLFYAKYVRV